MEKKWEFGSIIHRILTQIRNILHFYIVRSAQSALTQFFSTRWNFASMAANDYIVVAPNRRGMPGW